MILTLIIVLVALLYAAFITPTYWLKVERSSAPLRTGVKILQISDIHIERNRIKPERLARLIRKERPTLICLTGDFVDYEDSIRLLPAFLHPLRQSGVPIYAVLGNHDYFLSDVSGLLEVLQNNGVVVLRNQVRQVHGVQLVGIDDFCSRHHDLAVLQDLDPTRPIIVITHDPTIVLYLRHRYDYLMAGHLHGKQFAVPWLFKVKDFGPLARAGIYKGRHRSAQGLYYISKGIGQSGFNARFLVRSEVTIHQF
ncbi:MAG: metallophosphoesterase [Firmicutes bacterium]|nr:metallophosphoesterase [Bacillota bacterium]